MTVIDKLRLQIEKYGLNVSYRIASKLGIPVKRVQLFFMYISFPTLGLSFLLYISLAFALKIKDMWRRKRPSVFDL